VSADDNSLMNHLRNLGQHLVQLSDSDGSSIDDLSRPAIPLAAATHRETSIDDRAYLCRLAKEEYGERRRRAQFFDSSLFGEPIWDLLLDLFICYALDRRISVSSACMAAGVPMTTALRCIQVLEERGMIVRKPDERDRRRNWIELTRPTFRDLAEYLVQRGKRRRADGVSFVAAIPRERL
jgi:hypothetical protein